LPSPGFHWEAPDLIVRRQQDGDVNFVNEDLLRDGVTDHYVYGRVTNNGPNKAKQVTLAVTIGNYPSLQALPGAEFRYPQDWYPKDWFTPAIQARHLFLGESAPVGLASGATKIVGQDHRPAAQNPDPASRHPCILAEVRAYNNDTAGPGFGCDIQADPGTCNYGAYFWGNNNVCQRNLNYAEVPAATAAFIELPFIVGSTWSKAKFLDIVVEKGRELADTPMILRMDPIPSDIPPSPTCQPGEIVFTGRCRVIVRVGDCDVGEILTTPGTVWRPHCPPATSPTGDHGAEKTGEEWHLTQPTSSVGFAVGAGELRKMTLSFTTPTTLKPGTTTYLRIFQRNDGRIITGSVILRCKSARQT
jgi:hypothetical protein